MNKQLSETETIKNLLLQIENLQRFIYLETGRHPDSYASYQYRDIEKQS
jgi:hypothetical protein